MIPYYKLEKTQECKKFFFCHSGYFNFWDELLIMRLKEYSSENHAGIVLVNRTGRHFHGEITNNAKVMYNLSFSRSIEKHKPEQMFIDFPELERCRYESKKYKSNI